MKRESSLHISLMTERRREKEFHQGSLLIKMKKEGMKNRYLTLNVTIATRKVIMHETVPRRGKGYTTTPETKKNNKRRKDNKSNNHDSRYERRRRYSSSDREGDHPPQKKSRAPRYESNVVNKYEYILISTLPSRSITWRRV